MTARLRPRAGTPADAAEVVRLRQLMFAEMGVLQRDGWTDQAIASYLGGLADGTLIAVVVDRPDSSGLVATGLGTLAPILPGPGITGSRRATISAMSTDTAWRRNGLGRLVLADLLSIIDDRSDIAWTALLATADGMDLYTSAGFAPHASGTLRRPAALRTSPTAEDDPTVELPVIPSGPLS